MTMQRVLTAFALVLCTRALPAQATDLQKAVDDLIATDRGYAQRAKNANVVDALGGMFAADVFFVGYGAIHPGRDSALARLRAVPENVTGRLEWAPIRGGVSGDGQHGFTYGFMTLYRADSTKTAMKYLSYWVKKPDGWKVAVFKRGARGDGEAPTALREPSLPSKSVAPTKDAMIVAQHAKALGDAERDFSALAGKIGLGAAFTQNAAPDAMNMGGPIPNFLFGPQEIGAGVGAGETGPSTLTWGPDTVLVASSGDLGVTIGWINIPARDNQPARRVPFNTIWKKVGGVWKFVAE